MYRTILVPLDGTLEGARALPTAATLARAAGPGARLLLVRAAPAATKPGAKASFRARVRAAAEAGSYLDRVWGALASSGLAVTRLQPCGDPAECVLRAAYDHAADLIVMATHGRWGPHRVVQGSVAQTILRDSPMPVVLVGPRAVPLARVWRLLAPLDGGEFSAAALPEVEHLARSLGVRSIDLVGVVSPFPAAIYADAPSLRNANSRVTMRRDQLERKLLSRGGQLATWFEGNVRVHVHQGEVASTIAETAKELGTDLIVMRTHGRQGIARTLVGSVADELVRTATVPIVLYAPGVIAARSRQAAQLDEYMAAV